MIATAINTVVVAAIYLEGDTNGCAVTPDGKQVYVPVENYYNGPGPTSVSVIDTATNTVVATITSPNVNAPQGVAVTPDGKHVYVTNPGTSSNISNNVSVIDTATNTMEAATIPVGDFPSGVAVTPEGTHVCVANRFSNTVSVIDTATNTVVATVAVGTSPKGCHGAGPHARSLRPRA